MTARAALPPREAGGLRSLRHPGDCSTSRRADRVRHQPRLNLGDDITYSARSPPHWRGSCRHTGDSGVPAGLRRAHGLVDGVRVGTENFRQGAAFTARMVEELEHVPMPEATLLNVKLPRRRDQGRGRAVWASAYTTTRSGSTKSRTAGGASTSTATSPASRRGRHGLRGGRRRPRGRDSAAFRPQRPGRRRRALGLDLDGLLRPAAREV